MESIAAEDNEFTKITHEISNLLEISVENYYDIFTYILSSTIWQSPKEYPLAIRQQNPNLKEIGNYRESRKLFYFEWIQ